MCVCFMCVDASSINTYTNTYIYTRYTQHTHHPHLIDRYDKKQNSPDYKFNKLQANLLWGTGLALLAIAMYVQYVCVWGEGCCTYIYTYLYLYIIYVCKSTSCGVRASRSSPSPCAFFGSPFWNSRRACMIDSGGYMYVCIYLCHSCGPLAIAMCVYMHTESRRKCI